MRLIKGFLAALALLSASLALAAPGGERDWSGRLKDASNGPYAAGFKVYRENCAACLRPTSWRR